MSTHETPTLEPAVPPAPVSGGRARRIPRWVAPLWAGQRRGQVAAVAVTALSGLIAAWWTPRGPVTTTAALTSMVVGLVVGALGGLFMRSRWAMLLMPVVFVGVFEAARWRALGPTVDALRFSGVYGWAAAVSGRGVHGFFALAPLVLGAGLGAAAARRILGRLPGPSSRLAVAGLYARRGVAALLAIALVLLGALVARPAATDPIVGADGKPLPGSVAELTRARVGDRDLSMMIRGVDVTHPVMLFLAGGPGGSELGAMRKHGQALEQDFVVVTLDQRGTGTSYDQLEPTSTFTLAEAVEDVLGVTDYLRDRFDTDQVYLVGQSWGTILGVRAVQASPELFRAFVGVGQMVSPRETDRLFYRDTLAWAQRTGRVDVARTIEAIGPPPYQDLLDYPVLLGYEQDVYPYDHTMNAEGEGQMVENLPAAEYGLLGTINVARGLLDTFALMYPQLQDIDFRHDATRLDVPVYLLQGRYEARGRAEPAKQWFAMLQAPSKQWIEFDTSGHRPLFEQPELFHQVMTQTVLPQTAPAR